jgi:hypothetical protein
MAAFPPLARVAGNPPLSAEVFCVQVDFSPFSTCVEWYEINVHGSVRISHRTMAVWQSNNVYPFCLSNRLLASACASLQALSLDCIVMPWPLHAFLPLQEFAEFLQALWPLHELDFSHLTLASSAAEAVLMLATANNPATAVANAMPLNA